MPTITANQTPPMSPCFRIAPVDKDLVGPLMVAIDPAANESSCSERFHHPNAAYAIIEHVDGETPTVLEVVLPDLLDTADRAIGRAYAHSKTLIERLGEDDRGATFTTDADWDRGSMVITRWDEGIVAMIFVQPVRFVL